MTKDFIDVKFSSEIFCSKTNCKLDELKDKKVLIYGVGKAYERLNEKFSLVERLNIVGYSDKKFEETTEFNSKPAISPDDIEKFEFDTLLITQEFSHPIEEHFSCLGLEDKLYAVFKDDDPFVSAHYRYLQKIKFGKHLKKIEKKLKNKKIVIYGTGALFRIIYEAFDLSKLNIIGISDKKYELCKEDEFFKDKFEIYAPDEIADLKPDYVLVGTLYFVKLIDILESDILKGTKIRVKPLINKPFWEIFREVWY